GGGPTSTASLPHEPGMSISCSYFLTAALQNAGLKLESRTRFAQAPAAWIEQALLPPGAHINRYGNLSPEALERRLLDDLGDGLYVMGLDIHVGFLVIREGRVSFVHSSYTPPGAVVDEPLASSLAIANSQRKGYWVSPLFRDDRLVDLWLRGRHVPAPPQWRGRSRASCCCAPAAAGARGGARLGRGGLVAAADGALLALAGPGEELAAGPDGVVGPGVHGQAGGRRRSVGAPGALGLVVDPDHHLGGA